MSWTDACLSLVVVLLLVALNAFFVAAEFSIVRVRRTRLEELAGQGVDAARVSILLVERLSESLVTTQLGVTMASLGVGWLGEDAFAQMLALAFPSMFAGAGALHFVASALAFAVVMFMHVVLGEMVPKTMAIEQAEAIALRVARPLYVCGKVLAPLVWTFSRVSRVCMRWLGHRDQQAPPLSQDELRLLLAESHEGGVVTFSEAQIIHRAFEFADKTAADILVPAEDVAFLSLSRSVAENVEVARRSQHTRLPLCRDGFDSVFGIVNMKDAWPLLVGAPRSDVLETVSRPVPWIDVSMAQDRALLVLQRQQAHMGCVRDATGAVLGILTLDEVLESLFGDLREARAPGPLPEGLPT